MCMRWAVPTYNAAAPRAAAVCGAGRGRSSRHSQNAASVADPQVLGRPAPASPALSSPPKQPSRPS
eukprot:CAMPEP_0118922712 /NCGR_PEP_ID=MMETSP1169-20130426/1549_1 /TAXON_ID=36882 /ORGANISM="Pyramimonas obovata, Strain CCMP722" /LENGTH=65 /DNA_ID=CAMNT_0006863627 /DNA_START=40 /DNA_END=237 /DNA_ORIENTATION=+